MTEYPLMKQQVCLFYRQCVFIFQSISYFGTIPVGTIRIQSLMTEAGDAPKQRSSTGGLHGRTCQLKNVIPLVYMFCPLWKPYSLTTRN
jgi:hypothetical protein